jgi:hypothetical protein
MSKAMDWVKFKLRFFMTDMRYDAAIWNRRVLTDKLTAASNERFKIIHSLEEKIVKEQVSLDENLRIAQGAAAAFTEATSVEDALRHRQVGEEALAKANQAKEMVESLRRAQQKEQNDLVELRKDYIQEDSTLKDLILDKPRAMADLQSSFLELNAYNRQAKPIGQDKSRAIATKYRTEATARRDTNRFMHEDVFEFYKNKVDTLVDTTTTRLFDELVDMRRAAAH